MAPRSGKRRRRSKMPIPIWVPLPRPCLRSLNMPGSYYMPVPPDYFNWSLPPPYYTKPICHCADDNFCNTSNCQNSNECSNQRQMFCPYGIKDDEQSDSQQNTIREENDNEQGPSDSEANVCLSCGASPANGKRNKSDFVNKVGQLNDPSQSFVPTVPQNERLYSSSYISKQKTNNNLKSQQGSVPITRGKMFVPIERGSDVPNESSDESNISKFTSCRQQTNGCAHSSCQTSYKFEKRLTNTGMRRKNLKQRNNTSTIPMASYAEDSENSYNFNVPSSDTQRPISHATNEFDAAVNPANSASSKNNEFVNEPINQSFIKTTDRVHVQQLPDQLSYARKGLANAQSRCCTSTPGSGTSCKMQTDIGTTSNEQLKKKPKSSASRKVSECKCSPTKHSTGKPPNKKKDKSHMTISETKLRSSLLSSSDDRNGPCKSSSATRKASECICSSTKGSTSGVNMRSSVLTSSGGRNEFYKTSSGPRQDFESGGSSAKLSTRKSFFEKTTSSLSTSKLISCQCRYPPAYSNLSCTGSLSGNCKCSKTPLNLSE